MHKEYYVKLFTGTYAPLYPKWYDKLRNIYFPFKANHLAYVEPRWYGSQISAACQQKLFLTKHDTSGRFLLVTFLEKRENGTLTQLVCFKMVETAVK